MAREVGADCEQQPILASQSPRRQAASPRKANKEVKKPRVKQFWGTCRGKSGHFFGRIHAMTPQQGIHGFQRLTMIKFYTKLDENGQEEYDPRQVWAFEGCVLPGGRIVIGRWWDSLSDPNTFTTQSGPFSGGMSTGARLLFPSERKRPLTLGLVQRS